MIDQWQAFLNSDQQSVSLKTCDHDDIGLLLIEGPDAKKLLQGQLTCDMNALTLFQPTLAAHCNPQGRVISLFYIIPYGESGFALQMPRELIPLAKHALEKYAVFYKVTLNDVSDIHSVFVERDKNFTLKIPSIYQDTSEKFLPHDLGLHTLGVLSFDKGCYTGQEVISRMHYRGKLKNQFCRGNASMPSPPHRGEDIYDASGNVSGSLVDCTEIAPQQYDLLFITNQTDGLFLDAKQLYSIEIL